MKLASFEAIVRALEDASVRYLVVGGLAVNAHGFLRFTKDVDFVVQLAPDNIERAFVALRGLGYRPMVPITAEQFADVALRESWIRDKGMQVLQFWSDQHIETPVDLFVTEPFPFEEEYERSLVKPLHGAIDVRFVCVPTDPHERSRGPPPGSDRHRTPAHEGWKTMPKNEPPADGIDWRLTTWDGSRREQLRRWAALPWSASSWPSRRCRIWPNISSGCTPRVGPRPPRAGPRARKRPRTSASRHLLATRTKTRSTMSATLESRTLIALLVTAGFHVCAQKRVDLRLVTLALGLEPLKHVHIQP